MQFHKKKLILLSIVVIVNSISYAHALQQNTRSSFPAADPRGLSTRQTTATTTNAHPTQSNDSIERANNLKNNVPLLDKSAHNTKTGTYKKRKRSSVTQPQIAPSPPLNPITLVTPKEPEFLYGQSNVHIKGNQNPVIKLGISKHGPVVVEFPAADRFFIVHEASPYITYGEQQLTLEQKVARLESDHFLVFRTTDAFPLPQENKRPEPIASISVQMTSGMFLTFLFYPVASVTQSAHSCIVMYSPSEVVAARKAAGLPVNLDGGTPSTTANYTSIRAGASPSLPTQSPLLSPPSPMPTPIKPDTSPKTSNISSNRTVLNVEVSDKTEEDGQPTPAIIKLQKTKTTGIVEETHQALVNAIDTPSKFVRWTPAVHGLSISALTPFEIDGKHRLIVVAIRNTTNRGLRLLRGQPDLDINILDEKSRPVQLQQSVRKVHTETSSLSGTIPAGSTVYYAIVYETPILSTQQRLTLSVAHTEAADEPASSDLTSSIGVKKE
jgi:hypothetical protein